MAGKRSRFYSDGERAFLTAFIPGHASAETAEAFERRFGRRLKAQQVHDFARLHGLRSGVNPGHFRKGRYDFDELPVGGELVDERGFVHVKVSGERNIPKGEQYRLKHHLVWERENGRLPDGWVVLFADRDKRNFDPANLVAMPRRLANAINGCGMGYYDEPSLRTCMAMARIRLALKERRSNG